MKKVKSDKIYLQACIVSMDGKKYYKSEVSLPVFKPEDAGKNLALKLISRGAGEVLDQIKNVRTKA